MTSRYDDVIKHVESTMGAVTTRRFNNVGHWSFCAPGRFSPMVVVAWCFHDAYNTFSYYVGDGLRNNYMGFVNGMGCLPAGCSRQETFKEVETDEALSNLKFYVGEAMLGLDLPRGDIYLSWTAEQRAAAERVA